MTTQRSIQTLLSLSLGFATIGGCDVDPSSADLDMERDLDALTEGSESDLDEGPIDHDRPDELDADVDDDATESAPINLALGRPTTQSSTYGGAVPQRAVDGVTDGHWDAGSVTHTNLGTPGWWQVDLEDVSPVGEIVIYNRTDCCALLQDFDVRVSSDGVTWETFSQPGVAGAETRVFINRPVRYVRIENPDTLHIAEVKVLSLTTHWGDFSRGDCVGDGERLYSAILWDIPPGVSWEEACAGTPATLLGEQLSSPDVCVNTGFNMWGEFHVPDLSCVATPHNLALGRPTTQSSTAFAGDAARAVDGNTDGSYGNGSVSHTDYGDGEWWQVDLQSVQRVREVVVHNRTDCCADKLHNFRLSTSADGISWKNYASARAANPGIAFSLDRSARYVRITNGNDYLHLAEVEVFGLPDSTPTQHWGDFQAEDCIDDTHRKFSAILWDIPAGISWEEACAGTPASVVHDTFARPTACVNTGLNMWGEFSVRDGSCTALPTPAPLPPASAPVMGLSPSTPFSVVLASDPQLYWAMVNTEYPLAPERWGSRDEVEVTARSHVRAMRLLADGNQLPAGTTRPEAVIVNGDLTNFSRYDEYDAYYRLYDEAELGMPRFDGLGNHDYGTNVVGDCAATLATDFIQYHLTEGWNFCALDAARRMRAWITNNPEIVDSDHDSMAYAFVRNNVRFLQLQNYPGYADAAIGIDASYAWITDQMEIAQAQGQYVVLNMHIVAAEVNLGNDAAFLAAVAGHEHLLLAIFGGHIHSYQGQYGSVLVNGTSVPVAYGGSQQYNNFTMVQFDLDKVTFLAINSRDGNPTVVPGSVIEIPYPQQNIGAPLLDIPLTTGSLMDDGSGRSVTVLGTSLATDHRGRTDGARQLDGVDDAITIDANGWAESNTNTFTLAGWLDWGSVDTNQIGFLFGRGYERMEVHTGGEAGINGLRFIPAGFGPSHVDAPGVLSSGWNHVAFTYSGTVATIYLNGQQVATRTNIGVAGAPAPIDLTTNSGDLRVGKRVDGTFPMLGRVDGIALYDEALSQSEIVNLMLR